VVHCDALLLLTSWKFCWGRCCKQLIPAWSQKCPAWSQKNRWCDTIPAVDIYIYIILYHIYIWIYEFMILYIYVCYILLVGQNFVLHFNASFDMYWLDLICPNVMGFKLQQSPSSHGLRRSPRTRCSIHPLSPRSPTYRNLANLGEQAPRWQPPIHISDMQQRTTRKQQENNKKTTNSKR
jgi:hypothetical protein